MKIFKIIQIFLLFKSISPSKKENYNFGTRYTSVQCNFKNNSLILRHCYLKPISRKLVTFNLGVTIPKPIDRPINIQMSYFYRYGNIYREVMKTPKIEWCGVVDGVESNPLMISQVNEIRKSIPNLLQKCPYPPGDIDLNISSIHEMASAVLWDGQYRCDIQGFKGDVEMYMIKLAFQIKSDVKGSFG